MPNRPSPNLADLPESTAVRVRSVTGRGLLRERLVELGFVTGVVVEVLRRAAFGGPLQVRVRGGTIALRRDEAACVELDLSPRGTFDRVAPALVAGVAV